MVYTSKGKFEMQPDSLEAFLNKKEKNDCFSWE
jgi:hypothetical protein